MLIGGTYRFRAGVYQRAGLKRFQAWQPPAGFTFQGHGPRPMAWEECSSPRSTTQPPRSRRPRLSPTKRNSKWSGAGRHGVGADQRAGVRLDRLDQLTLPDRLEVDLVSNPNTREARPLRAPKA
jgi:hypothetical protein